MSLEWIFDPAAPSGAKKGGLANAQVFDPSIDAFVREVLQNARDQRRKDQDKPVRVRFRLLELTGAGLKTFLDAMAWAELEAHVSAAAAAGGITISGRLREGLAEIKSDVLRILVISDSNTNGLTGAEDDDKSNFNALCRHELITSAERRDSGGSFGLGKSVLWRFSSLSTVLFSSFPVDQERIRLFGRVLLPWHSVDDKGYEGSGWFGERETTPGGDRAISVWDQQADALLQDLHAARDGATGTSIVVVGFDEPALEQERPIKDVAADIATSAARWFWPALQLNQLEVTVEYEGTDGSGDVLTASADLDEIRPFVLAATDDPSADKHIEMPGDVAEREIPLNIPAQNHIPGDIDDPRPKTVATATLRVRVAHPTEDDRVNTIALQRGTGMVVAYQPPVRVLGTDIRFHADLLVGRRRGESANDQAAEEFLRAAEPPAHGEWTGRTERVKQEYKAGTETSLRAFQKAIFDALRDVLRAEVSESDDGPEALRKMFPLPGAGPVAPKPFYRLEDPWATTEGLAWNFGARYARKDCDDGPWQFKVRLHLDQEAGGNAGEPVRIKTLEASGAAVEFDGHGAAVVTADHSVLGVMLSGTSEDLTNLPAGGIRQVRLRMTVDTV